MKHPLAINIEFIIKAHILNPLWRERTKRRNVRCLCSYRRVEAFLEKYRDFVRNLPVGEAAPASPREDERIFSIWFQGLENAPKLVKVCMERLTRTYGDRHIVLGEKELFEMITLPEPVMRNWREGTITAAHLSDICRVELLYSYGGMWFDATDFLTSPVPEWVEESDLFIYNCGDVITPQKLIQSCFMRAVKGHPLMGALRAFLYEYWKNEHKLIDYFLLHYMLRFLVENNEEAYRLFYSMPVVHQDPTHILWHKNRDLPFSEELYRESTKDSFFQKTTFKCKSAEKPIPGSVADYIINGKIPL